VRSWPLALVSIGLSCAPAAPEAPPESETYGPCPPGQACAIMPLGDSITVGYGEPPPRGGYRIPLFRRARAEGRDITFVGSAQSGPTHVERHLFPRANEGHSGFGIGEGPTGLTTLLEQHDPIRSHRPDIVLLMIGTNDITDDIRAGVVTSSAPARLARLVDRILDSDPHLLLLVAQIIPRGAPEDNGRVEAYNAQVADLVRLRAAAGRHIGLVDVYRPFVANAHFASEYLSDLLHPSARGFDVIGEAFYQALQPYLR
jgi:lysophospholipase L1-like esterase